MTFDIPDSDPPPVYDSQNMAETKKEQATSGPEPRYIYYRVYTLDGAIPSKSAFDSNDPFVGRIAARSVPPPRTVTSLKKCLTNMENISDPAGLRSVIYLTPAAPAPMSNSEKVVILGPGAGTFNGSTPETAFALVFLEDLTAAEIAATRTMNNGESGKRNPEYIYYHLFTQVGEDTSTVSFNPHEPALGRVEKIHISPPHSPVTIKRHIARVEGKYIYGYAAQLYEDVSADTTIVDSSYLSLLQDDSLGSTADKPMVLVQPERREGLYNCPVRIISKVLHGEYWARSMPVGTILYTDRTRYWLNKIHHQYRYAITCGSSRNDGSEWFRISEGDVELTADMHVLIRILPQNI
ncbi:hypothetical protein C8R44DRAFT_758529 [Mycena epipterygia]|nr:hypothetical protein C8R44DRAFT_758529 [Mycena epipterygia]